MRWTRVVAFLFALFVITCAGSFVYAQTADPNAPAGIATYADILKLLSSTGGVIVCAMGATRATQRLFGTHPWFSKPPVWVYVEGYAVAFAWLANHVLGVLPGPTGVIIMNALLNGASGSGVYSWFSNGIGTPMSATTAARLPAILLATCAAGAMALGLTACAGSTTVPVLPTVLATTDLDVRSSLMRAYQDIGAALTVLDAAQKYEAAINASGGVPAAAHHAAGTGIIKVVQELDSVNSDIKSKALSTYAAIKARVDPIITDLNTVLTLTKSGGFNWLGLLSGAVNLIMDIIAPGVVGAPNTCVAPVL